MWDFPGDLTQKTNEYQMSVLWEYFQHNPLEKVLLYALEVCLALEEGGGI